MVSSVISFRIWITLIFLIVVGIFLFPLNQFIPLDRRIAGLFGATLCGLIHLMYPNIGATTMMEYVDVDVLLILLAIMAINFMVMRQPVVLQGLHRIQSMIQSDPEKGIWMVSLVSFMTSPFITNDGLCLLLTWPVLDAFHMNISSSSSVSNSNRKHHHRRRHSSRNKLIDSINKFYFCLAICCSANIGSAMTYTGNPQNIIIASHLSRYMSGGIFFGILIVPAVICCLLNTWYLNFMRSKEIDRELIRFGEASNNDSIVDGNDHDEDEDIAGEDGCNSPLHASIDCQSDGGKFELITRNHEKTGLSSVVIVSDREVSLDHSNTTNKDRLTYSSPSNQLSLSNTNEPVNDDEMERGILPFDSNSVHEIKNSKINSPDGVIDALHAKELESAKIIASGALPWFVFPAFATLMVLELSGLPLVVIFLVTAILLVPCTLLINYYRHISDSHEKLVERRQYIMKYIEALFHDLDYNLIFIFIGLFIVSGSFVHTRIPAGVWSIVAGSKSTSFRASGSVAAISAYIIFFSQLVGNVPLVYMAAGQMDLLPIETQRYGWVLLAWVSTVAGNFTLCGSAANIIVAEKASRHSGGSVHIGAIKHFKVCGLLTLICIVLGVVIIAIEFAIITN